MRANVDLKKLEQARDVVDDAMRADSGLPEVVCHGQLETRRKWNRAVFKRILISAQRVKQVEYQEPYRTLFSWAGSNKETLVARSGFEPLISALRGLHPRPLDERAGR